MSFVGFVGSVVGLTREAVLTNFWGLACPIHCSPSSIPLLALTFLVALLLGFLAGSAFSFWLLCSPSFAQAPSSPQDTHSTASSPPVDIVRRRLLGYRPYLHG